MTPQTLGQLVEVPELRPIARLDYDSREALHEGLARMRFLFYGLPRADDCVFQLRRFRTRRGYHVDLYSNLKLSPAEIVALQAILGSDYRREAFNLFRVHALPQAPSFWRRLSHWNILHQEKLT